jgi:L-ribulose-5-phosphate 4-epimerase
MNNQDSMFLEVKQRVYEANLRLHTSGLVKLTFGNVSEKLPFEDSYLVAIKPSGIAYEQMRPDDITIVSPDGMALPGSLRPSSDTATHLVVYEKLPHWSGVAHTHSVFATAWAQSGLSIPIFGTTHADYLPYKVPCTTAMLDENIQVKYERNTGLHLIRHLQAENSLDSPMVLVQGHGAFTFGKSAAESVEASIALEEIAQMAYYTLGINPLASQISQNLIDKHYLRKHGTEKYYGQNQGV